MQCQAQKDECDRRGQRYGKWKSSLPVCLSNMGRSWQSMSHCGALSQQVGEHAKRSCRRWGGRQCSSLRQERKCAELVEGRNFVENLAWAKSRDVVLVLHHSTFLAWRRLWTFTGSLTSPRCNLYGVDGVPPDLARNSPRTHRRNPASGNTAGSIGHLPPPTALSGRAPYCQANLPQIGHIFGLIQGPMQAWSLHMHPQLPSSLSLHICSGCCFWRRCASPCRSRRRVRWVLRAT